MESWLGHSSVKVYNNIHISFLPLNYAYVILNTTLDRIGVYSVSEDCYKCPYQRQRDKYEYSTDKNALYEVYTGEQTRWRVLNHIHEDYIQDHYKRGLLCDLKPTLEEYGVYRLDIGKCAMETEVPPINVYLPLLFFSLIMLSGIAILALIKLFLRRNNERYNDGLNLTAKRDNSDIMPSLHFLRGLLLILIIFVTTGGGGYPICSKDYGGLTIANCLLFAYTLSIGFKVPIMFEEESRRAISKWSMFCVACLRSFVLLFLGIAICKFAPRSRYLGAPLWAPLHCIALCHLTVALFYIICTDKRGKPKNSTGTAGTLFWSWFLGAFLLTYMIVSIFIFYYTECKQHTEFDPQSDPWTANGNHCQENAVLSEVFNKNLLGVNRDGPFYIVKYYAFTEGMLGILSFVLTGLVGLKAGVIYIQNEEHKIRLKLWCLWAVVSGVTGVIFAALSGLLNFNLWPISSIFFISSATLFIYIFVYYLTEVRRFSSNTITTCGIASIATLSGHLLFSHSFPFYWGEDLKTHFFYLWQSTWVVFLWVVITIGWVKVRTYLITKASDEGTRRAILAW